MPVLSLLCRRRRRRRGSFRHARVAPTLIRAGIRVVTAFYQWNRSTTVGCDAAPRRIPGITFAAALLPAFAQVLPGRALVGSWNLRTICAGGAWLTQYLHDDGNECRYSATSKRGAPGVDLLHVACYRFRPPVDLFPGSSQSCS